MDGVERCVGREEGSEHKVGALVEYLVFKMK